MCELIINVTVVSWQACVSRYFKLQACSFHRTIIFSFSLTSPLVFCLLSTPVLSSLLSLFFLSWGVYHYVYSGAMLYNVDVSQITEGERARKKQIEGEVGESAFVCHCTHLVMSYLACTRGCLCAFVCSLRLCVSLSLCLCFVCMFYVFHFQAVINSLTPTGPEALPFWCLLLFALILSETCTLLSSPLIFFSIA